MTINTLPGPESSISLNFYEVMFVSGSRLVLSAKHPNAGTELITVDLTGDSLFEWGME